VDPVGSYLGRRIDSHRDSDVRSVLAPLARLAEVYGPAVLVVAHHRKSPSGNADDMAMGSRAFTGVARAVWHLTRDPHDRDRRFLVPGKNNLAAAATGLAFTIAGSPPAIAWEPDPIDMTATDALAAESATTRNTSNKLQHAADWLANLLTPGPMPVTEIREQAEETGLGWRTIERAKTDLGVRVTRPTPTGPWHWELPAD